MIQEQVATIVRDFEDQYASAFNRRDVKAFEALFTEGATIVTEWGDVVVGRRTFAEGLQRAFAVLGKDLQIENRPSYAVALTEDVIVSHGITRKFSAEGQEHLVYTRVFVREGGQWRLAANHVAEASKRPDPRATKEKQDSIKGGEI